MLKKSLLKENTKTASLTFFSSTLKLKHKNSPIVLWLDIFCLLHNIKKFFWSVCWTRERPLKYMRKSKSLICKGFCRVEKRMLLLFVLGHNAWFVGLLFPNEGSNGCRRQWEHRALTIGLPGNSQDLVVVYLKQISYCKSTLLQIKNRIEKTTLKKDYNALINLWLKKFQVLH